MGCSRSCQGSGLAAEEKACRLPLHDDRRLARLGSLWSGMAKPHFFPMLAVIVAFAGVAILAFERPLKANLRE
jgi:hypothetical protein